MKKIALFIFFLGISLSVLAQDRLLTYDDILKNESKLVRVFKKLKKKPKKKRRREKFIKEFNRSFSKNSSQLKRLEKSTADFEPNYEAILNKMKTLQFLYDISKDPLVKDDVKAMDYTKQIDSVTDIALQDMYQLGKEMVEHKENALSYMTAYHYLKRVENLRPNYLETRQLIDQAVLKGRKRVYFLPVVYDNLGSFVEFGFGANKASMSSDFILKNLINELQIDNVGSTFVSSPNDADWVIALKWEAVNMGNKRFREYTEERSTEIEENDKKRTVKATVKYVVTTIDVSGRLNFQINARDKMILNKTVSGFSPFSKKEATFTGDKRALTNSDLDFINNKPTFVNDNYDLLTKMYLEVIHPKLMDAIGPLLNWNYRK